MVWNDEKNFVRRQFCKTAKEEAYSIEKFRQTLTTENLNILAFVLNYSWIIFIYYFIQFGYFFTIEVLYMLLSLADES